MKKVHSLLLALATLCGLASCSLETDSSGKLGGFWHLVSVDTLATGGHADLSGRRVFWSVQNKLMTVNDRDGGDTYLLRYAHTADSLTLSEPRLSDRMAGDPAVSDPAVLQPLGIQHTEEGFAIELLNGSNMVLRSTTLRLGFKKF